MDNSHKHLLKKSTIDELIARIEQLHSDTPAHWGQMNVAQMLAHCSEVLKNALGQGQQQRKWLGYVIAPFLRHRYYNHRPFSRKNVPSTFQVVENKEFLKEQARLQEWNVLFYEEGKVRSREAIHPMLGKFKPEQWAIGQYKHIDHHLRQFGV